MLLGVSQPAISNYLKGRIPPAEILVRMASLFSISMDELYFGEITGISGKSIHEPQTKYVVNKERYILSLWKELDTEVQHLLLQLMQKYIEQKDNRDQKEKL
ncbi:MAG: hypothetical protein Kow00108_03810 [Calditrichia bacterium]